jgi:hypothetical protein
MDKDDSSAGSEPSDLGDLPSSNVLKDKATKRFTLDLGQSLS